tara:strand:- start:1333 stop:1656 length:324 start_codon:yes stop_codon:yes gene_type:complete
MAIKLLLLQSNEEVIADVQELVDENDKPIFIVLTNPFIVKLVENPELEMLNESTSNQPRYSARYYEWMPLSKEKRFAVNPDWIVTAVEPIDAVMESYKEKMDGIGRN